MAVAEDQKERFDKKLFWRRPRMRLCRVTKSKWKRQLVKSNRAALREDSVPAALFTDCLTCLPSSLWSATLANQSPPKSMNNLILSWAWRFRFPVTLLDTAQAQLLKDSWNGQSWCEATRMVAGSV